MYVLLHATTVCSDNKFVLELKHHVCTIFEIMDGSIPISIMSTQTIKELVIFSHYYVRGGHLLLFIQYTVHDGGKKYKKNIRIEDNRKTQMHKIIIPVGRQKSPPCLYLRQTFLGTEFLVEFRDMECCLSLCNRTLMFLDWW